MSFADHFSGHATAYAKFRPDYPPALYAYLASLCRAREVAWDCGTGNGQAAVGLSGHFVDVIATDPAFNQVRHAPRLSTIHYAAAAAEAAPLSDASVDVVSVAQALHWFDLKRFYTEVRRVLRPDGVLAAWGYGLTRVTPAIDRVIDHYYRDVVGPYWPPERRFLDEHYQSIDFPFGDINAPSFEMEQRWPLSDFVGYLNTWSAAQRYARAHSRSSIDEIYPELAAAWGEPANERVITWPLFLRVARIARH